MVKIAASAAIRAHIPTRPRAGSFHSSRAGRFIVVAPNIVFIALVPLLVFPVRIVRILKIPERAPALNRWHEGGGICRRRRIRGPFESPCIPGIASGGFATVVRPEQVSQEDQDSGSLEEISDGYNEVPCVPTAARLIGIDSSRHAEQSGDMNEVEGKVEADYEKPEMDFAERFAIHLS